MLKDLEDILGIYGHVVGIPHSEECPMAAVTSLEAQLETC
jgi:hypothetical protein